MIFTQTDLKDAYVIDLERHEDERGFFARSWCVREFEEMGLDTALAQCNLSYNARKGTTRGMHYQRPPHVETKFVRCVRGAIYDVIIDLRPDSPTFRQWIGVELTAGNRSMLYVPKGFAHGFQTLTDDTEIFYMMSELYAPDYADGLRWDDPLFDITWPGEVRSMSEKDRDYPDSTLEKFEPLRSL